MPPLACGSVLSPSTSIFLSHKREKRFTEDRNLVYLLIVSSLRHGVGSKCFIYLWINTEQCLWNKRKRKRWGRQKKEKNTNREIRKTQDGMWPEGAAEFAFLPAKAAARKSSSADLEELLVGASFRFLSLSPSSLDGSENSPSIEIAGWLRPLIIASPYLLFL